MRKGTTATHIKNDYQGKKGFLMDMACYPGLSESPVFICNEGSFTELNGRLDVIEPHGTQFTDNINKAKGLAKYCLDQYNLPGQFNRVQLVREITKYGKTKIVRLELNDTSIRNKVLSCVSNEELNHIFETEGFSY